MAAMTKITDDKFETEIINSDRLTLVDFGATWCSPCQKLHPVMDQLGEEYDGQINIFEVDVGDSPQTAMKYGITSVPQLLFFKDGIVKETIVGLLSKSKIEEKIEQYL